jgi:lambda family phage minor tail protein L
MTAPEKIVSDLQGVAPSQVIELFELQLKAALHGNNDIYRFHAGVNAKAAAGAIVWSGNSYQAYPVEADGFEYSGEGQLPRPRLRVSNQLGLITTILIAVNTITPGNDLIGAKLTRIRVLAKHVDAVNFPNNTNPYGTPDPTAEFPREVYYIARKNSETRDIVEFELAAAFDLAGIRAPRRLCIANMCNWVYRSAECGYTGAAYFDADDQSVATLAADVCSKRLSSCELRFAAIPITASVTSGSTTLSGLTTAQLNRVNVGDPVFGHGIPSGTTVTAKASSSVTLSQAANSSSTLTQSGTLSANGLSLVVSSATGLRPGMTVSGANVPANTTITSVSGTTVNLSIAYNSNSRGSAVTRSVQVSKANGTELWLLSNTSGIASDDLAGNNSGITANNPHGEKIYANTKITAITANVSVQISKLSRFDNGDQFTAIFWQPVTFNSATYTFTGSPKYTIRANNALPFGSFPGVGGFYA